MDCLLMRHGIAVEPEDWSGLDETRPLTDEGKKKVRLVARGLAALGVTPTHLIASPLKRAQETAQLVRISLCPAVTITVSQALEPGSSPLVFTTFLATLPESSVVLCVGHEPLLGTLASYFLCGHTSHHFPMKKAGVGFIHMPTLPRAGEGTLRWWCTPAQLRGLAQTERDND